VETTRLSSKGQIIIPKAVREAHLWQPGQEFLVVDTGDGILLQPRRPFAATQLADVAGMLPASGSPRTLEEMEAAIRRGVEDRS
jgi:AbrB family looped-hinge helix DNA binding protein